MGPTASGADTGAPPNPPRDEDRSTARLSVAAVVTVGGLCVLVGAVLIVPFPFAAVGIAAWWLAAHLGQPRRRYPGRLGIGALVLLTLAGAAVATFVIGFDTYFDCGGTLGGFGAGASAELDESCVDAQAWRTPALTAVMSGAAVLAALTIRRATGIGPEHQADDREHGPPPHHRALAVAVVVMLAGLWTAGMTGSVVS